MCQDLLHDGILPQLLHVVFAPREDIGHLVVAGVALLLVRARGPRAAPGRLPDLVEDGLPAVARADAELARPRVRYWCLWFACIGGRSRHRVHLLRAGPYAPLEVDEDAPERCETDLEQAVLVCECEGWRVTAAVLSVGVWDVAGGGGRAGLLVAVCVGHGFHQEVEHLDDVAYEVEVDDGPPRHALELPLLACILQLEV